MILIIDDDSAVRSSLSLLLKRAGYEVEAVNSPQAALDFVRHTEPKLMLMDMNFSLATKGDEGLDLLQKVKLFCPATPVILITAWGSISLAVRGMQAGAFDFITKPWDNRQLLSSVATALDLRNEKISDEIPKTRKELDAQYNFSAIIGKSNGLTNVLSTVARIANTNASVLITGESGTGKELVAEAIHKNSRRRKERFVKVNLGGVSQSLFESEMFGHKKGAFTDAHSDREGRFELALLERLPFPGNIRELKNLIDRTILISGKKSIDVQDIRSQIDTGSSEETVSKKQLPPMTLENIEAQTIKESMALHNGNISKVAKSLGLSRAALYRRMEKHGL